MRIAVICSLAVVLALALFVACNSREASVSRNPNLTQTKSPAPPQQVHNPADDARRITAQELHDLWEQNKVLIVDTRNDAAYNQGHIKGAILIPSGDFAARLGELPKDKMIVTYCT